MTGLRIVFAGSPAAAVPTLRTLEAGPHHVERVITRPPARQGRRQVLTPTPVAQAAEALALPVYEATRLQELEPEFLDTSIDLGVIVAYGALVKEPLLSWPRLGWINLHFSLLPRWRGAAPVQHALMAGDAETGATVFQLTPGLDDGEWYAQHRERIDNDSTAGALLEHLSDVGARLTASVVDDLARGAAQRHVQEGEVTVAPKLERDDGRLRWTHDASAVLARWRGVTPEPGAWTSTEQGLIVKVLALTPAADAAPRPSGELYLDGRRVLVGTRSVPLELTRVQPAGKQQMSASDWARGWGPTIPRLA